MVAGETAGVVEPPFGIIGTNVIAVPLSKLLNGILNCSESRNDKFSLETPARRDISRTVKSTPVMVLKLTLSHHLPSSPLC